MKERVKRGVDRSERKKKKQEVRGKEEKRIKERERMIQEEFYER